MTALDGALPFTQVNQLAVRVTEDLDLDVAGSRDVALEEHPRVAEAAQRLALGGAHGLGEPARLLDDTHSPSAAAGRGLDQQRVADCFTVGGVVRGCQGGHTGRDRGRLGGQLVSHDPDDFGGRTDPHQPGRDDGRSEGGVLGQEPVPGVDGVGAGGPGRGDDRWSVEVPVGKPDGLVGLGHERSAGVGLDVDGHAAQPHGPSGPKDAPGDLAAVGDEHAGQPAHRRNTP